MRPDQLVVAAVILRRHEVLDDEDQTPECVLLVHEEQGDGGDPVEALAVLHVGVVDAVGQKDAPQLGDPVGVRPVVVLVVGQRSQQIQLDLLGRRRQLSAGVIVGQQLLVVVRLETLVAATHQLVVHDGLPDGALGIIVYVCLYLHIEFAHQLTL